MLSGILFEQLLGKNKVTEYLDTALQIGIGVIGGLLTAGLLRFARSIADALKDRCNEYDIEIVEIPTWNAT